MLVSRFIGLYLILIYFSFCLAVASAARTRGKSVVLAFLISLFLTPFAGLLYLLILRDNPNTPFKQMLETGEVQRCPKCGEYVGGSAFTCRYCLHVFKEPEQPLDPLYHHNPE